MAYITDHLISLANERYHYGMELNKMSRCKDQYFDEIEAQSFESIAAERATNVLEDLHDNYRPSKDIGKKLMQDLEAQGRASKAWRLREKI